MVTKTDSAIMMHDQQHVLSGARTSVALVYLLHITIAAATSHLKPHLLFVLVDDYGYADIGYHNINADGLLSTPNLDKLASGGIKLEQYYVQPICTPTRSQLLTGRYQIHTGLQHGVIHPQMPSGVPTNMPMISNQLQNLGYRTHLVGKWHVGFYNNASCPWNRGFDTTLGYLGGEEDYWTHVLYSACDCLIFNIHPILRRKSSCCTRLS